MAEHRPEAKHLPNRWWRVNCSCGWRGPQVPLPGQGYEPWVEHFTAVA